PFGRRADYNSWRDGVADDRGGPAGEPPDPRLPSRPLGKAAGMAGGAGKVVGIDLGTTFSAIATLDDRGQPITLPNRDGEMLTPSAVMIDEGNTAVVGQAALDVALEQPDRVATLVKRRMGHASYGRSVADRDFRPETLSAIILK